jgi:hypothetical protein
METLSDCVFAWMRHEFAPLLGVCEQEIRQETPLARFLPSERRREFWRNGQRQFGLRFPTLQLPASLSQTGGWLTALAVGRTVLVSMVLGAKWMVLPLALATWVVAAALYARVTAPWATEHPELETFGDLSRLLLARNMKTFRKRFGLKPNRDEIFATVVSILTEMGADPRQITPESKFSDLLGM